MPASARTHGNESEIERKSSSTLSLAKTALTNSLGQLSAAPALMLETDASCHLIDFTTGKQYITQNDEFEWDDQKANDNYHKHGISFDTAREAFKDPFAIERLDDRYAYGEARYVLIGMAADRLLFVAYTLRGSRIRLISARGAESDERRQYHEEDS